MPEALFVFLAPPSGTSSCAGWSAGAPRPQEERERRLDTARVELAAEPEFDVTVVNAEVHRATDELVQCMGLTPRPLGVPVGRLTVTPANPGDDSVSGITATPEGITNPPIDELLEAADSKYALVIYAAKRARQINAYYTQLGEGLLEYVGPLVETARAGEAAVDRAARDQRRPADRRAHRGLSDRPGCRRAAASD